MELGPTAYVILGILNLGPHSGYDIKQLADLSTRHFWATSYGQIYPELKRLSESGLIKSEDASKGTRQRTLYHLTAKGKQTLHTWVEAWLADHWMPMCAFSPASPCRRCTGPWKLPRKRSEAAERYRI